jgi:hypothetical protein
LGVGARVTSGSEGDAGLKSETAAWDWAETAAEVTGTVVAESGFAEPGPNGHAEPKVEPEAGAENGTEAELEAEADTA